VEGDDFNEPVSDTVRGILDGHIVLSRDLASRNHYPAIDVLDSVSRVMPEVTDLTHQEAAGEIKRLLSEYRQAEDLINIGAYQPGSNPVVDRAINKIDLINDFLRQGINEKADYKDTVSQLIEIAR
ncbi:MAG: EscN/YscN/HrcN family type III secretion system ATPase, partial [Halanaerobiales bacterium]